ncbi:MAG: hypothetical protein [Sanya solspi-like virus 4]|nr:MAG: hypothetical protein [Sanya solspi-like virus 4]
MWIHFWRTLPASARLLTRSRCSRPLTLPRKRLVMDNLSLICALVICALTFGYYTHRVENRNEPSKQPVVQYDQGAGLHPARDVPSAFDGPRSVGE